MLSALLLLRSLPLHAPLPLKRFLECPLTAPLLLTRFSARYVPFSAPFACYDTHKHSQHSNGHFPRESGSGFASCALDLTSIPCSIHDSVVNAVKFHLANLGSDPAVIHMSHWWLGKDTGPKLLLCGRRYSLHMACRC